MFEFYNRTGIQIEEVLLKCFYRGEICSYKDFKTIYTRYGKCYSFNNPDNLADTKQTLKGGVDNGLELLLDVQQNEYMPMWKESGKYISLNLHTHFNSQPPVRSCRTGSTSIVFFGPYT